MTQPDVSLMINHYLDDDRSNCANFYRQMGWYYVEGKIYGNLRLFIRIDTKTYTIIIGQGTDPENISASVLYSDFRKIVETIEENSDDLFLSVFPYRILDDFITIDGMYIREIELL